MEMLIHVKVRGNVHVHVSVKQRQWPSQEWVHHYHIHALSHVSFDFYAFSHGYG